MLAGHGKVAQTLSTSPDTNWTPEIPADQVFDFDLDKARQMLEDAGYKDTDGDGVREMPGGGQPLNFTYYVRSDGETAPEIGEFVTGWLKEIGIATTKKVADDSQLTTIIGKGDYDMFDWGWTPFVDPDPMLSYFTCDQVSSDPEDPSNYYNDANYCDPEYDKLYQQQKVELDRDKREQIVHEMLTRFQQSGTYHVLYTEPELQAYRKGRFEGFVRQPAKIGPVVYPQTSPTYAALKPASASSGGDDGARQRRDHRDRRRGGAGRRRGVLLAPAPPHGLREGVSARFIGGKVLGSLGTLLFVVCFNFFLFRVVETDPVANLYRGHNLTQTQRAKLTQRVRPRQVHRRAVRRLPEGDGDAEPRPLLHDQPAGLGGDQDKAGPTIALVGVSAVLSAVFGIMLGIAAAWRRRPRPTTRSRRSRWPPTRCRSSGSG